jgi:8-oxo-dGTP pyrophosphatase MutT (NUDIX family)
MTEAADQAHPSGAGPSGQASPRQRPRDAATLILIDRSAHPPKVLLGRRHEKHVFMPGKFVFPGGRVEPQDRLMPFVNPLHPQAETWLMKQTARPSVGRARAFALAAIRETFEETGLLLGGKRADAPPVPGGPWEDFAKTGFYPDLGGIHFIARAITPPGRTRRFDARFFCADASAIVHRAENVIHADAELVELVWLPITDAKRIDMPGITGKVLDELQARSAAGLAHDLPVPIFRTRQGKHGRELL